MFIRSPEWIFLLFNFIATTYGNCVFQTDYYCRKMLKVREARDVTT